MLQKIIRLFAYLALYLSLGTAYAGSIRTYTVIVPFSAGGASDVLFRGIEPALNARLAEHQIRLIVENKPGAAGSIGLSTIINTKDTPVFGFFSPFFAINRNIRNDYSYNYDSVNFLGFAGYNRMVVISGKHASINDLRDLCTNTGTVSIGSSGVGSTSHLSGYSFVKKYLKCKEIIDVPYKGVSSVYPDLKAGRIDIMTDFSITASSFLESNYFNQIAEIKETDFLSWHIFVSNIHNNPDIDIVKREFNALKRDKAFINMVEATFHIYKFSENKDATWLRNEFQNYKEVIDSLPRPTQ